MTTADRVEKYMAFYSISYDLHDKRNYQLIHEGIDKVSQEVWVQVLESQFLIQSNLKSEQIRDYLTSFLDEDDSLFVAEIGINEWASKSIPLKQTNVLHHWAKTKFA